MGASASTSYYTSPTGLMRPHKLKIQMYNENEPIETDLKKLLKRPGKSIKYTEVDNFSNVVPHILVMPARQGPAYSVIFSIKSDVSIKKPKVCLFFTYKSTIEDRPAPKLDGKVPPKSDFPDDTISHEHQLSIKENVTSKKGSTLTLTKAMQHGEFSTTILADEEHLDKVQTGFLYLSDENNTCHASIIFCRTIQRSKRPSETLETKSSKVLNNSKRRWSSTSAGLDSTGVKDVPSGDSLRSCQPRVETLEPTKQTEIEASTQPCHFPQQDTDRYVNLALGIVSILLMCYYLMS